MSRMIKMSEPFVNVFIGIFDSIALGSLQPIFGILIGKMLFVLQPILIPPINPMSKVRTDADYYCMWMFIIAILSFATQFIQISIFGITSENMTLRIRKTLYTSILSKNIGWFDDKEHTPGVLSSTMASEA